MSTEDTTREYIRTLLDEASEDMDNGDSACGQDHLYRIGEVLEEAWLLEDTKLPHSGPWLRKEVKHT